MNITSLPALALKVDIHFKSLTKHSWVHYDEVLLFRCHSNAMNEPCSVDRKWQIQNLNLLLNSGERALCPGTVGSLPWYQLSSPSQVAFLFFAVCWHHITDYRAIKIFIYQLSHICLPVVKLLSLKLWATSPSCHSMSLSWSRPHTLTFFLLSHSVLLQSAALSLSLWLAGDAAAFSPGTIRRHECRRWGHGRSN